MDVFLHLVTFCSACFTTKNCLTQAPIPCNCFNSCKASRPPCNKHIASFGEACQSLASMLLIKSAIDRFRSSLILVFSEQALPSQRACLFSEQALPATASFKHCLIQACPPFAGIAALPYASTFISEHWLCGSIGNYSFAWLPNKMPKTSCWDSPALACGLGSTLRSLENRAHL